MITRQEIFNIVDLFTSQSTINFYENIFDNLDLSFIPEFIESKRGPKGYSRHALTRAFVVMNCEHFREIHRKSDSKKEFITDNNWCL